MSEGNRVQGMVRSINQWRNMVPSAVTAGSAAQVEYALTDAKTDIEALWCKVAALTAGEQEPVAWPCSLGVGDGDGKLFVHGDYDSIKAAQAIIFQAGEATAQLEALRKERDRSARAWREYGDDLHQRAMTAEARVAELEAERDCYLPGLQLLATSFWKGDQYQAYAQHVIDAAEQAARRVREGGKVDG